MKNCEKMSGMAMLVVFTILLLGSGSLVAILGMAMYDITHGVVPTMDYLIAAAAVIVVATIAMASTYWFSLFLQVERLDG